MLMKVLIYGVGLTGRQIYKNIKNDVQVIGFLDGNPEKKGQAVTDGLLCFGGVESLSELDYDCIYIGSLFWKNIRKALLDSGVSEDKIVIDLPEDPISDIRNTWLASYAKLYKGTTVSVAEGGVFRGEFAKFINKAFPDSKLYLFDTFEGFDSRDVKYEANHYSFGLGEHEFSNTSIDLVMSKMEHPEKVILRKGFFPETAEGIDEQFCFVHLDFDLYLPILEGLRFFYPKMIEGSVILIHDYYNIGLPGVKDAIEDYEKEIGRTIYKMPIGEDQSIALIKDVRS